MLPFVLIFVSLALVAFVAYHVGRVDERRRAERDLEARWKALQAKPRVTRPDGRPLGGGVHVAGDELIMAPMEKDHEQ